MTYYQSQPLFPANASFASGGSATFTELWAAGRDSAIYADNFNAKEQSLHEAAERRNEAIFNATGERLDNPFDLDPNITRRMTPQGMQIEGQTRMAHLDDYYAKLRDLSQKRPEASQFIKANVPLEVDAKEIARTAAQTFEGLMASRQDFLGKWTAGLSGALWGSLRDPVQVGTLFLGAGAGGARTVMGKVLTTAFREATVNAAAEAALQPRIQAWREEAGLPAGFDEALQAIGFAGATAGALGAGGQIVIQAGRALFKGKALDAASETLRTALPADHPVRRALEDDSGETAAALLEPIKDALPPAARGAIQQWGWRTEAERLAMRGKGAVQPEPLAALAGRAPLWRTEAERLKLGAKPKRQPVEPPPLESDEATRATDYAEDPLGAPGFMEDVAAYHRRTMGGRPRIQQPPSLIRFIAENGGLKPHGDLRAMDLHTHFVPGAGRLVRESGMDLDRARELAVEAGYMDDPGRRSGGPLETTTTDFLDALSEDRMGKPVYSARDADLVAQKQLQERWDAADQDLRRALREVGDVMTDALPFSIRNRAVEHMLMEPDLDAGDAMERAIRELDHGEGETLLSPNRDPALSDIPFDPPPDPGRMAPQREPQTAEGRFDQRSLAEREADTERDNVRSNGVFSRGAREAEGGLDEPSGPEAAEYYKGLMDEADGDKELRNDPRFSTILGEIDDEIERSEVLATLMQTCKVI